MKVLIAPLNWGLGHATRCIPIIYRYLEQGDEVVLAGDGDSLQLLKRRFPELRAIDLPSLELRYTTNAQQRGFYFRAIWLLLRFTIADYYYLQKILSIEHFDHVISDNRFGLFSSSTHSVYITLQAGIHSSVGRSPLCPSLSSQTVKLLFSTSPKTLRFNLASGYKDQIRLQEYTRSL